MDKRNLQQKTNNYIFDGTKKCLDIPNRIGYTITKVRRVDLEREGDIDLQFKLDFMLLVVCLRMMFHISLS